MDDLDAQIDANTQAILINNPSNPCGSVYSREHISQILSVAEKHKVVIIADEIYADVVSSCASYHLFIVGLIPWLTAVDVFCVVLRCLKERSFILWHQSPATYLF